MKKTILLLTVLFLFSNARAQAQITLDFTVDSTIYGFLFYPTKISDNETKYVFIDTVANRFSLYNLDLTPFLTNVLLPTTLWNGSGWNSVMYLSRTLFDCDSTNIEYMIAPQTSGFNPMWIMRTDGTILLQADSTNGPYCLGCPGGTSLLRPILETEEGTKLVLQKHPAVGVKNISIYSLCGKLPIGIYEFKTEQSDIYVELFPNPTDGMINFEMVAPNNQDEFFITVFDVNGRELRRINIDSMRYGSIDIKNLSSGSYSYSLTSKSKLYQSGKFVLTR